MKVKRKLFAAMFLTLLLALGSIAVLFNFYIYRSAGCKAEDTLKAVSASFSGACGIFDAGPFHEEGGKYYKGSRDLSSLSSFAENLKNQTGAEISLYIGSSCVLSTISGKSSGENIIGTVFSDKNILSEVFEKGKPLFTSSCYLFSKDYYAFFSPVTDNNGEISGFVSAALEKETVLSPVSCLFMYFLIVLGGILLIAVIIMLCALSGVSRSLRAINSSMASLEFEDLSLEQDKKTGRRKDEFGEIYRSCGNIRKNLDVLYNNVKQASAEARKLSERVSTEAAESELRKIYSFFSDITEEIGSLAISARIEAAYGRSRSGSPVADRLQELAESSAEQLGQLNVILASLRISSGRDASGRETFGADASDSETSGRETFGTKTSGRETFGTDASGKGTSGRENTVSAAKNAAPTFTAWPSNSESIEDALMDLSGRLESTVFGFRK